MPTFVNASMSERCSDPRPCTWQNAHDEGSEAQTTIVCNARGVGHRLVYKHVTLRYLTLYAPRQTQQADHANKPHNTYEIEAFCPGARDQNGGKIFAISSGDL